MILCIVLESLMTYLRVKVLKYLHPSFPDEQRYDIYTALSQLIKDACLLYDHFVIQ